MKFIHILSKSYNNVLNIYLPNSEDENKNYYRKKFGYILSYIIVSIFIASIFRYLSHLIYASFEIKSISIIICSFFINIIIVFYFDNLKRKNIFLPSKSILFRVISVFIWIFIAILALLLSYD
jgi:hypothetical protein